MRKITTKRILTFIVAIAMVFTSVTIAPFRAEAASGKTVKSVTLKIGSSNVTNKKYTMGTGEKKSIKVTVSPKSAKKSITYKSGKTKVATVDKNGKITAKSAGTAKITVTVTGKDKKKTKKTITLTIQKSVESVTLKIAGATVTNKSYSMTKGEEKAITVTVSPKDAKKSTSFQSNNKKVAAVDKNGKITAKSAGTAKITVTVTGKDQRKTSKYINVTVKDNNKVEEIAVSSISATISRSAIKVGGAAFIRAFVNPGNATNQELTYSSSNNAVASVDNTGNIVGIGVGTAKITVKSANGKTADVSVRVVGEPVEKNASDVAILQRLINEQVSLGAKVPTDLDSDSYIWDENGRLIEIQWNFCELQGALSYKGLTELTHLECSHNELSSLDVNGCTALTWLYCFYNELSSLDVSGCTALTGLSCSYNELSSLDVSSCTALVWLGCEYNELSSLDMSKNTDLTQLDCYNNKLGSLDVSKNTALRVLTCYNNQLNRLDVSKNIDLTYLDCRNNELSSLDVSKNTALTSLSCDERVTVIGYPR